MSAPMTKAEALATKDVGALTKICRSELAKGWENIPPELAELSGWLLWKWETGPKKATKVPYYAKVKVKRSGQQGSPGDRAQLCTLAEAVEELRKPGGYDFAGVGLAMLADWNLTALDFDHVIEAEKVAPWVSDLVDVNVTYGEASPSDTGARVFYRGLMPPALRDKKHKEGDTGFETFCAQGFVTVTGKELGMFSVMGDPLPELPESVVTFAETRFQSARTDSGAPTFDPDCPFSSYSERHADVDLEGLRWMLDQLGPDFYDDYEKWRDVGFCIHHQFHGKDEEELDALEAWIDWSAQSPLFVGGECEARWEDAKAERTGGIKTIGTLKAWVGLEKWKAYKAERKAATSAAVAVAQDWESQIKQAPDAATLEKIAAQVRATSSLSEGTIATLAGLAGARCKVLNIDMRAARWKKLMTPRAKATHPASVDLADFIPYGLPEPELNPSIFPHVEYTESTIRVKNTLANAARMLEAYGITAYYDGIKKKPVINIPGLSVCSDQADTAALARIESLGNLNGMAGEKAARFAATVAYENQRNLIGDWIKSAPWDRQDRIAQLCDTLTVRPDFPLDLRNLIVRRWLISAAAAALKPAGFYSKGVLTLQGPQSIGKTPWVASLLPDGVLSDYVLLGAHLDPYSRDSIKTAVSHWIVELGEVDSTVNRAEGGALKAFLSQRTDKLRLPYAPVDSEFQRRTVFAASVNPQEFLKDETGNKRWWTLPVTAVNFNHGINLQQLWAQVAAAYEAKEPWWLTFDEENRLESYNSQHTVKSSIHEILADALDFEAPRTDWKRMTATGVLQTVLQIKVPTNAQAREVGTALRALLGEAKMSKGHPGWWVPPAKFDRAHEDAFDD